MQDPYSAIMHGRDERFFRPYGPRSNVNIPTSSYYGMSYSNTSNMMMHSDLNGLMTSSGPSSTASVPSHSSLSNSALDYTGVSSVNSSNGHDVQQLLQNAIGGHGPSVNLHVTPNDPIPKTSSQSHQHLNMNNMSSPMPTSPLSNNAIKQDSGDIDTELSSPSSTGSGPSTPLDLAGDSKMPPKKRPLNVPDNQKDGAYWEKRKKNNDSAKRSREARRMKEEQIALRVVFLEQENLQLRTEVSLLKSEIEKLRCMLYTGHNNS